MSHADVASGGPAPALVVGDRRAGALIAHGLQMCGTPTEPRAKLAGLVNPVGLDGVAEVVPVRGPPSLRGAPRHPGARPGARFVHHPGRLHPHPHQRVLPQDSGDLREQLRARDQVEQLVGNLLPAQLNHRLFVGAEISSAGRHNFASGSERLVLMRVTTRTPLISSGMIASVTHIRPAS